MDFHPAPLDTLELRRLSCDIPCDPRSILRELREPGSVRGIVGERIRAALRARAQLPMAISAATNGLAATR